MVELRLVEDEVGELSLDLFRLFGMHRQRLVGLLHGRAVHEMMHLERMDGLKVVVEVVPKLPGFSTNLHAKSWHVRGGPGGGGGLKPNFDPIILDVLTPSFPLSSSSSSPHRATTPRNPSPLEKGGDDVEVPVPCESDVGG